MQEQSRTCTSKRTLATHCHEEMKDYSESGHGRRRNRKMLYCYGCCTRQFTEAFPGTASSLGQNTALTLEGPSWSQTSDVHWHYMEVHTDSLKGPALRLAEQFPSESFAYMENLFEEFIHSVKRKLVGAMLHIVSTLWKFQPIQLLVITSISLFRPYRIHIKILLPTNFGIC